MKVSTIIKIVSLSLVVIIASFTVLVVSNDRERSAISTQATYKQLGLDLSAASDLLTNEARAFVQYGEKEYYDAYMKEVNVTKTRDRVVAELKALGAPQSELDLVEQAYKYSSTLAELETLAFEAVEQGDLETARQYMFGVDYDNGKTPIVSTMNEFQRKMAERTNAAAEAAKTQAQTMLVVFSILFGLTTVLIIASLLSIQKKMGLIAKLVECASQIAVGNIDIEIDTSSHDEVGALAESFRQMVEAIRKQATIAEQLAAGDLTVDVRLRSAYDTMGIALKKMVDSLNDLFGHINHSTVQVSTGSKQIAVGAQALAQGSAEQTSSIEELSGLISEIAEKTKRNAEIAKVAATLSDTIRDNAEMGSMQMANMVQAVREINDASAQIERVIKIIDNIAFQTNILALNAAVEAARAGAAGKGFAVVAEEVRNLAAKSAEAAKDTGSLIGNSVEKANLGLSIATETSASLKEIVEGIRRSAEFIAQISLSSDEQAGAINQVNVGIDQVAMVVHQTSATARESAAASQEMSGEADILEQLITQFKLKDQYAQAGYAEQFGEYNQPASLPSGR